MGPALFQQHQGRLRWPAGDQHLRLFPEGKKNNQLGVHLQHLSVSPSAITGDAVCAGAGIAEVSELAYYEPIRSPLLTHACTAPVQDNAARIDDCAAVVTAAWLELLLVHGVVAVEAREQAAVASGPTTLATGTTRAC
ncbi:hypothetical protein QYE76_021774 [Lolium multiflorum]|uniref:Uncharacterized protein n=1 Tax=Lolium multiflorum TaxID=4521 RepID=A0AAD8R9N8_LOLMU|nr:hypothetical protein QYE76_021774 [Lolium multiflorum]